MAPSKFDPRSTYDPLDVTMTGVPAWMYNESFGDLNDSLKEQEQMRAAELINESNELKLAEAKRAQRDEEMLREAIASKAGGLGSEAGLQAGIDAALSQGDIDTANKLINSMSLIESRGSMADKRRVEELLTKQKLKDLEDPAWRIKENAGQTQNDPGLNSPLTTPGMDDVAAAPPQKTLTGGMRDPENESPEQLYNRRYREVMLMTGDDTAARQAAKSDVDAVIKRREQELTDIRKGRGSVDALNRMGNQAEQGMQKVGDDGILWFPPTGSPTGNWIDRQVAKFAPFGLGEDAERRVAGRKDLDTIKPDVLQANFVPGTGALSDRESQAYFSKATDSDGNIMAENEAVTKRIRQAEQWQREYLSAKEQYILNNGSGAKFDSLWDNYKASNPLIVFDPQTQDWEANPNRRKFDQVPLTELKDPSSKQDSKVGTQINHPELGKGTVLKKVR